MIPTHQGSFRLFRFAGIQVFLHWSWFLFAFYKLSNRDEGYSSPLWQVAEYLALFGIVLLHEFGHALACRQVKGQADEIVLWPLGGLAYVSPPQRPGAQLWSIVAGPLVNVALVPILYAAFYFGRNSALLETNPDLVTFLRAIHITNVVLLVFNLLPIYPLDGGQALRSLLWFVLGRARSLFVATLIGFAGVAGLLLLWFYVFERSGFWTILIAFFVLQQCVSGFRYSRALLKLERAPRHEDLSCPTCRTPPPQGPVFTCGRCGTAYDPFDRHGVCPNCQVQVQGVVCPHCHTHQTLQAWGVPPAMPPEAR